MSANQLAAIRAAEAASKRAAALAYSDLRARYNLISNEEELLRRFPQLATNLSLRNTYRSWFGAALRSFGLLDEGFNKDSYKVSCGSRKNCRDGVYAYVRRGGNTIYFCAPFFSGSTPSKTETFIHESSHLLAKTQDLAIGGGPPWMRNPHDAYWYENFARNPENYLERFVRTMTRLHQ